MVDGYVSKFDPAYQSSVMKEIKNAISLMDKGDV
jgi:hypothetical protein